ncbi:probable ADP-ribosylation factor GTPase-activating protein AGD14 isoform X1 [Punica granatum]|uniref:Probable ADP-ribosylation factor GTPase-activating protein AGD14 isoform X1 n=1 Tax=Punica granatum TaxID=22663 RepID=A0A6P8CLN3_PUNGR|nr:probable ADP-ribosylation factor GTPase-activating protein AGD14 isoform X1 [Punica granatum]
MGSRREEERNEKIIRGLMKLPPNRRCINCNSLGPQYVCTNFWTFVCVTCSGIHREFTHRVKSVSMAKFTSKEVEALQNGGNQRARETYLKDWDPQRQRLPDSSNADKVREFIKNVYVDRRYAGEKNSEKPPRDVQSIRSQEEETRRASSYHSYSQSPPYDYQYEERRYGKPGAALTRKPGSDRGLYEGKVSSFVYSPGRHSEHMYEDRFANEGSGARVSDYSVSSGGDPFRSGALSPTFQRDAGYSSPPLPPPRGDSSDNLNRETSNKSLEANVRRDADGKHCSQRTASSGSFGSFDSNSMSLKSFNSGSLVNVVPESEQVPGTHQDKISTFSQSTVPGSSGIDLFQATSGPDPAATSIDLFQAPFGPEPKDSSIDLFQAPPSIDLFQSSTHPAPSPIQHQIPQTTTSASLDFFADFSQQSHATMEKTSPEPSVPKNEGWATFDSPQPTTSAPADESLTHVKVPSGEGDGREIFDMYSTLNTSLTWPSSQKPDSQDAPTIAPHAWDESLSNVRAPTVMSNAQPWNAFGEPSVDIPSMGAKQTDESLAAALGHPSNPEQYLALEASVDFSGMPWVGMPRPMASSEPSALSIPSDGIVGPPHTPSLFPFMGETSSHGSTTGYKSTNPFDFPFDTDTEQGNMQFLDMSSLQAALPDPQLPNSLLGGVSQPWFPQNPVTPYSAVASQGGLAYMAGQAASPQISNVPVQGPVASIGGNPFD